MGTNPAGRMTKRTSHAEHASLWCAARGTYRQNLELFVSLSFMSFTLLSESRPTSEGLASGQLLATRAV